MSTDDAAADGAVTCPTCGTRNPPSARFCQQCGASMAAAKTAPSTPPVPAENVAAPAPAARAAPPAAAAAPIAASPAPRAQRSNLLVPGVIGAVVVLGLLVFLLAGHPFAKPAREFATREVEVRSSADPRGSTVLGHFQRGDVVTGAWVTKPGKVKWLKVKWPGAGDGYVSARDLSDQARPELASTGGGSQTVSAGSVVYAEPDVKSTVVDNLSAGEAASTVGATAEGWTEVTLPAGGVGYVKSAAFQTAAATDNGAAPAADQTPAAPELAGVVHYVCAFSPDQSVNPPPDTAALSFYLDEGRACINHRYAYLADASGGLKRVMLNDKYRRASLLYFMPGRKAFYRTDFTLSPDAYEDLLKNSAALQTISCPPPDDATAAGAIKADLARATPNLDAGAPGQTWRRRVWQCSPA